MPKTVLEGIVLSDKMDKTIVVKVERLIQHPFYKKFIKKTKKYMVHDEDNVFVIGDRVKILESSPYSKNKSWKVINN